MKNLDTSLAFLVTVSVTSPTGEERRYVHVDDTAASEDVALKWQLLTHTDAYWPGRDASGRRIAKFMSAE